MAYRDSIFSQKELQTASGNRVIFRGRKISIFICGHLYRLPLKICTLIVMAQVTNICIVRVSNSSLD